jgi:protocatechuate 3,4-dioxygenase beta subunit
MDPDFRYWGETFTDADGAYWFKTIIPGAYPAGEGWTRPPHIHFRVARLGFAELITQMYFKGNGWNDADLILQAIPAHERDSVIVDFSPGALGVPEGTFDITLKGVRG